MYWLKSKTAIKLTLGLLLIVYSHFARQNVSVAANVDLEKNIAHNAADVKKYQQIFEYAQNNNLTKASMGTIVQAVAEQFLGAEYQAGLLDKSTQESLVISLQQFDCLLFVETVLAIADNVARNKNNYQGFTNKVEEQRYWNGKMNGYCSRLHYFSDWIVDNEVRGNVKNITTELGGISTVKKLNFMTTHRSSYPILAKSDRSFECIARVEDSLSTTFDYIPTNQIDRVYDRLQPGDIIGVATNIPGLDFTHTGFVYQQANGNTGFIHASPAGKVTIAKDLQQYISNVENAIGIVVSRANEPKLR